MINNRLVGRQSIIDKILLLLDNISAGAGLKVVSVSGSAGTGKSSLINLFFERVQLTREHIIVANTECIAQTGASTPYQPFVDIIKHLSDQTKGAQNKNDHWTKRVQDVSVKAIMDLGPDLLGTIIPGGDLLRSSFAFAAKELGWFEKLTVLVEENKSVEIDTSKVYEQYSNFIKDIAAQYPLVLCIDDAQWADTSSLHLVAHLIESLSANKIMILLVSRESSDEESCSHVSGSTALVELPPEIPSDLFVDLDSLSRDEKFEFTCEFVNSHPNTFTDNFSDALFNKTDGHPHFTVEIVRKLYSQNQIFYDDNGLLTAAKDIDWSAVPSHYDTMLKSKLDVIDPGLYDLLAWASIEGTTFHVSVLAEAYGIPVLDCAKKLSRILDKKYGFVIEGDTRCDGGQWLTEYSFVSSRLRNRLYDELSQCERRLMHSKVAETLTSSQALNSDAINALIAHHFEYAGELEKSSKLFFKLGTQALRTHAYVEAIRLLDKAILQIKQSCPGGEGDERLIEVYLAYCTAIKFHKGWRSEEALAAYQLAIKYCRASSRAPKALVSFLFGVWGFHLNELDFVSATELANDIVGLSKKSDNKIGQIFGLLAKGNTSFWRGNFDDCQKSILDASSLFNENMSQDALTHFGVDPRSFILMFSPICFWICGDYEAAVRARTSLFKRAEERDQPFDLAFSLFSMMWQSWLAGDREATGTYCHQLTILCQKHKIEYYLHFSELFEIWVSSIDGKSDVNLGKLTHAYKTVAPNSDNNLNYPFFILLKSEINMAIEDWGLAIKDLRTAICWANKTGCIAYLSEYWRLLGVIQAGYKHNYRRAFICFEGARKISKKQGAIFFYSKSSLSYTLALVRANQCERARSILAELDGLTMPEVESELYTQLKSNL